MVSYNNLWTIMKNREMTKTELRTKSGLSTSTFAKLGKNELVALEVLVRICRVLQCQLGDICYIDELKEGVGNE